MILQDHKPVARVGTAVFLVLLAIVAYANSFPGIFVADDFPVVCNNPLVVQIDLYRIFTTDYWGELANSGLFRPLTILSFGVNRLLLGPGVLGFHLVNVLLHGAVTLLLWRSLSGFGVPKAIAWLAAALFAVHPIHTEVVNEVVGRSELLVALFLFAGFWLSSLQPQRPFWAIAATTLCYGAALLSKEHGIVFLMLLPLLDHASGFRQRCAGKGRVWLYLILLIETVLWLTWRTWGVLRTVPEGLIEPAYQPLHFLPLIPRVLTALKLQWLYLRKLVLPIDLQAVYSGEAWLSPVAGFWTLKGMVVLAATLALAAAVVGACRRGHWSGWGMALYAIAFAPTANIFFVTGVTMAERLAYLPSAWFCLAIAAGVPSLCKGRLQEAAALIMVAGLLILTLSRNRDFSSQVNLWSADVARDPGNVLATLFLASSLNHAGEQEQAEPLYREVLGQLPDFREALLQYSHFLFRQGRYDEAIEIGLRAEKNQRGVVVENRLMLARAYLAKGQFAESLRWLEKCKWVFGTYGIFWEIRGRALEGLGSYPEAIDSYRQAVDLPADSDVPLRLANLLLKEGRYDEAETAFRDYLQHIKTPEAWNALGVTLALRGRSSEAAEAFRQALLLAPDSVQYRENYERASSRAR